VTREGRRGKDRRGEGKEGRRRCGSEERSNRMGGEILPPRSLFS